MTEQDKAVEAVQRLLKAPTPTLLSVRKRLVAEGEGELVELIDATLLLRPDP